MNQATAVTGVGRPRLLRPGVVAALAVLVVAVNLRAPMTAIPPLIPQLETELGLSGVTAGLITTLPVLCMGLLAPAGQRLGHRIGRERAITAALVLLLIGTVVRAAGGDGSASLAFLYAGTLLVGAGIAVTGALLPSVVKDRYRTRSGLMTGAYMGGMSVSAALGALLAVPLALALGSWQLSIVLWAVPVVLALAIWAPVTRSTEHPPPAAQSPHVRLPWTHSTAWLVVGYLILQSTQFYTQAAWIPSTYEALGWSDTAAGVLLTVFAAAQGLTGAVLPALTDRVHDNRTLLLPCTLAAVVGIAGVTFAPESAPFLWMLLIGAGLGAGFGLGLVYLVDYAADGPASARLTAMAFLFSYCLASLGPVWFGALRDATGDFELPWAVLLVLAVIQVGYVLVMSPNRRRVH